MSNKAELINSSQVLIPLTLTSFVLLLLLGVQSSAILTDRQAMIENQKAQEKPLDQAEKVKAQLNGLAIGTLRLSLHGNKEAENIITRLRQMGISVTDPTAQGIPTTLGATPTPAGQAAPPASAPASVPPSK